MELGLLSCLHLATTSEQFKTLQIVNAIQHNHEEVWWPCRERIILYYQQALIFIQTAEIRKGFLLYSLKKKLKKGKEDDWIEELASAQGGNKQNRGVQLENCVSHGNKIDIYEIMNGVEKGTREFLFPTI